MNQFELLFGIKSREVASTCVLLPLAPKGFLDALGVGRMVQGKLYRTGQAVCGTVFVTGMGPLFVGDAVLHLSATRCRRIILFGSCGLVRKKKGLSLGDLVTCVRCDDMGAFSDMLMDGPKKTKVFFPHNGLLQNLLDAKPSGAVRPVAGASVASLKMEDELAGWFAANGIDVVDMECAAFFCAAAHTGIRSAALLYISDSLDSAPFYAPQTPAHRLKISASTFRAASIITGIAKACSGS